MNAIEMVDLNKKFGLRTAIERLNLTVKTGEIFGFVGPNGSGKTTTIKMITGLLRPSAGAAFIEGYPVSQSSLEVKRRIGYMPDQFGVYPEVSVWEYLDFFSSCYQIEEGRRRTLIDELLELVDLGHRRTDMVDQLSRGLKQRLSLARTLIHDPHVLILDEPAAGLDPRARVEIRALLLELSRMGKTIFFSTHILSDVAEICTKVGIIEAGVLAAVGSQDELQIQVLRKRKIELMILGQSLETITILDQHPGISVIETSQEKSASNRQKITFDFEGEDLALSKVITELVQAEVQVLRFFETENNLEEVFLQATRGIVS